ncbi:MAG: hypothetical protein LBO08_00030 [Rickettsiales bacterium]|jgi:hypothetical protein|nr:hypothetical protein [Rickettsiales bacterium]
MQLNKSSAEQILRELHVSNMPLMEIPATFATVAPDWFARFKTARAEFMRGLTDAMEQLSFFSFSQDEFMGLISGRRLPENFSVRLRIPVMYGGRLEPSNMFLCKSFPFSHNLDRFILGQRGAASLWLPNPKTKIYNPTANFAGGDGGNDTGDIFFKNHLLSGGRE